MTNLENLRKRARQIQRWHRERNYAVVPRIRAALPRYDGLDDAEVLAQRFVLADAQLVLAREAGFDSWAAFITEAGAAMRQTPTPDPTPSARPTLREVEPQLFVTDIEAAYAFFERKLGFRVVFTYGEPPFYGQVRRDEVILNLRHVDEPVYRGDLRESDQLLAATITVDDVKGLYTEYLAAGVDLQQPLRRQPWGAHQFVVRDPDGNLVLFSQ